MKTSPSQSTGIVKRAWRTPAMDAATADMLAVVTLYASGRAEHADEAGVLLDELMGRPEGETDVVAGLVSVASALLVLLEFSGGVRPDDALQQIGTLVAYAGIEMD